MYWSEPHTPGAYKAATLYHVQPEVEDRSVDSLIAELNE